MANSLFTWRDSSNVPQSQEADYVTFEAHHVVFWRNDEGAMFGSRVMLAAIASSVHGLRESKQ